MKSKPRTFKVRTVTWKGPLKIARLTNGRELELPRSACVTTGENVVINGNEVAVKCQNGYAMLLPTYVAREVVQVGELKFELMVKEITDSDEMAAYQSLAKFHYRDQPLFGRTARLVVRNFHPGYPKTIGYIELATPFYMNKPRAALLNRPFSDRGLHWSEWNKESARKNINSVVRIARCVIYPEFRGVGLGRILVTHAREFARERWQVGGIKPCFLEISADMLKYVSFAESGGLHFIGETQGNLERVAQDLSYLLQNQKRIRKREIVREEAFGIVDQQVSRMNKAATIMRENGWSLEELLDRLRKTSRSRSLRDLSLLRQILSLPKPTYMGGLTPKSESFVQAGVRLLKPKNDFRANLPEVQPLSRALRVNRLTIDYNSYVAQSRNTSAVQQAFGISPESIQHQVINDLSFSVEPGQIAMIVGPSGSGKSTLLRFLSDANAKADGRRIRVPSDYRPAVFEALRSQRPLIDALANSDVTETLQLLGVVSLSDAFVYLKRFSELSAGQQYRAMLANMIRSGSNVWIADEFCVNLDVIAANNVAHRLRNLAKKMKAALIVASPQPELIVRSLRPDVVIRLTTAWENEVISGDEFISRLGFDSPYFRAPSLGVDRRAFRRIADKKDAVAIVRGNVQMVRGPLYLRHAKASLPAVATRVEHTSLAAMRHLDLKSAGYSTKKNFIAAKQRTGIHLGRTVTAIYLSAIP